MFYRRSKSDIPLDFSSQSLGCRLSKYIIYLQNESYDDKQKSKGVDNIAFTDTDGANSCGRNGSDTKTQKLEFVRESSYPSSDRELETKGKYSKKQANKVFKKYLSQEIIVDPTSGNNAENENSCTEDSGISDATIGSDTKSATDIIDSATATSKQSTSKPLRKSATISEINNSYTSGNLKQPTGKSSNGLQTDISSGESSADNAGPSGSGGFDYCRGDFVLDDPDSLQTGSSFKRSLSFGDRHTRRRTSTTQTGVITCDAGGNRNSQLERLDGSSTDSEETNEGWRLSLEQFTSKRFGSKRKTEKLSKGIRKYYETQDELIDSFRVERARMDAQRDFYKSQDELINQYEEIRLDVDDAMENSEIIRQLRKKASLYAKLTFFVNLVLLVIKVVAVWLSGSISLISSLVDSTVDLVSGVVIWVTTRAVKRTDRYIYPQGRTKLEPMAIVILSVIMSVASLQIIKESFTKIANLADDSSDPPVMDAVTIGITSTTVVAKLVLWLMCRRIQHPTVQALAMDHRNDVLSNFVAIVFGYIGSQEMQTQTNVRGLVYLDPVGAIVISIYIIVNWCITGWDQIKLLVGHTAQSDFISKITWIAMDHHKKIQKVDTVRAFHFGNNFLVEVDIVLDPDMTVKEAHDIAEPLQQKIETLPTVERAFVHVDYEFEHDPTSEHKRV